MLALDVAGALPVVKTVIQTGKNIEPAAQQIVQKIDDGITTATKRIVDDGIIGVNEMSPKFVARATATPKVDEPL